MFGRDMWDRIFQSESGFTSFTKEKYNKTGANPRVEPFLSSIRVLFRASVVCSFVTNERVSRTSINVCTRNMYHRLQL